MRRVVVFGALPWAAVLVLLGASVEAAAGVVRLQQVAYQGEAVTLPSDGDPTQTLASIKWSVFFNETWIATFHGGKINTERFFLFRGRLTLNTSSGDLTIRNLSQEDAGDYSVELVDTEKRSVERVVTLVVKRHLQKPSVETLFSVHKDSSCWVGLRCLSPDLGTNLSWKMEPSLRTAYNMFDPDGGAGVLLVLVAVRNSTHFTCTSSRDPENISNTIRIQCAMTSGRQTRGRDSLFVLAGLVSGGFLMAVLLKHLQGQEDKEEVKGAREENG
ncbi:SLAM family member 9-like isoform X1 [Syngnathoides biaculeatus]|uniref:SLAM family member 9-like isoform X1 n=1 Tax=Syngnathoides biaculeatus TaxID=300417 RepID=UPI002ADE84F4|nr:SLAM family member 9-like isoform X1 [Syngnathoides biaculeatus]